MEVLDMSDDSETVLYVFPRYWGLPNVGPYCLKVEAYLRMTGEPHRVVDGDLRAAPRGQLPYARIDGRVVGDSGRILEVLEARRDRPLDGWLGARERAIGASVTRTLEESLVWALRYARFVEPSAWPETRGFIRACLPPALRLIGPALVRRGMRQALHAQGTGRFDREQIYDRARADLDAAANVLDEREWLLGDGPSTHDAALFGFVASCLCEHARSPLTDHALARPNLVAHTERVRERWFAEYPSWVRARRGDPAPALAA